MREIRKVAGRLLVEVVKRDNQAALVRCLENGSYYQVGETFTCSVRALLEASPDELSRLADANDRKEET